MPDNDHAVLRALVEPAVRDAGALALGRFRGPLRHWTKDNASPVSEIDIAVDELLHERLAGFDPAYGWLSEETYKPGAPKGTDRTWIIDPIDGTRAYIGGLPDWSVVVALVEHGRPLLAAIFAPVADEFFFAFRGAGATVNAAPIRATDGATLAGSRAAGPHRFLERLQRLDPNIAREPKVHSLALRLARVAQGRLDIAFASDASHDWDLAAADLLVHEAGGTLTTLDGRTLVYDRPVPTHGALIAAGRARHQTLIDLMRDRQSSFA